MKIIKNLALMIGASALTLAATTGAHADTILNYVFDAGTTFDFGGGNTYTASGTFNYNATTQLVTAVNYTATQTGSGPTGPFVFNAATTVSPTDVIFTGDAFGDEDEFFFAHSLALGGTNPIIGFSYFGTPYSVTGSVSAPGSVPEPAAWAMLLVGFGGIGTAMRARRKQLGIAATA